MLKSLRMMRINLTEAAPHVTGKAGMPIIDAILEGERNPLALAALRDDRCRKSEAEIAKRLDGVYADRYLASLRIDKTLHDNSMESIDFIDDLITAELEKIGKTILNAAGGGGSLTTPLATPARACPTCFGNSP